jgi:hypothetical protein
MERTRQGKFSSTEIFSTKAHPRPETHGSLHRSNPALLRCHFDKRRIPEKFFRQIILSWRIQEQGLPPSPRSESAQTMPFAIFFRDLHLAKIVSLQPQR